MTLLNATNNPSVHHAPRYDEVRFEDRNLVMSGERWVWAPDETRAWVAAKVTSEGDKLIGNTINGQSITVDAISCQPAHTSSITGNFDNLVQLEEFSEGAIIHQLERRYERNSIYTSIGSILISINPFKLLDIYSSSVLSRYKNRDLSGSQAPHAFGTASNAYWGLILDGENQSVVISGESGAGKTEATKLILQYLSDVAGSSDGVEQEIMQSNPILEAFGNSKTLRNNNSSRFGKWMEIRFQNSKIKAAKITNYLLEKSRVVYQSKGERNYHIFYQLCAGADQKVRSDFNVLDPSSFAYLNKSECMTISGVNDFDDFQDTCRALSSLEFTDEELYNLWRLVSGVLYLGNVDFDTDGDGSKVQDSALMEHISYIFQIDSTIFDEALRFRAVTIRNEVQKIKQNRLQAQTARDSVAKTVYGAIFDWLIMKINTYLNRVDGGQTIGVLDIFGFEVFEHNSFEQFCINYANEKLQQHFNHFIFKMEQQEYKNENIKFDSIAFVDNQQCLDLIEMNPGILAMLDEEVVLPKGGDKSLVDKYHAKFAEKGKSHPCYVNNRKAPEVFVIKHYAGDVAYEIIGFVDKNRDDIYESLQNALLSSKNDLLKLLFDDSSSSSSEESKQPGSSKHVSAAGTSKKKSKTLGSKV